MRGLKTFVAAQVSISEPFEFNEHQVWRESRGPDADLAIHVLDCITIIMLCFSEDLVRRRQAFIQIIADFGIIQCLRRSNESAKAASNPRWSRGCKRANARLQW